MAFGKKFSKSSRSSKTTTAPKSKSFKRFGSEEKPERKQKEDKPWAIYNERLGVIFAKPSRSGPCYAAEVEPGEAESLVRNIAKGKEKGIFNKSFLHKPARER